MTDETPLHLLTPEEASARTGVPLSKMKADGELVYLMVDSNRTRRTYMALWSRWARGKANMPQAVENALIDPELVEQARATARRDRLRATGGAE